MTQRRAFLLGLGAVFIAAPPLVRASSLDMTRLHPSEMWVWVPPAARAKIMVAQRTFVLEWRIVGHERWHTGPVVGAMRVPVNDLGNVEVNWHGSRVAAQDAELLLLRKP